MIEGTCSTLVVGHDLAEAQERGPWHLAVLLCGFIPLLDELMAGLKPNGTTRRVNGTRKGASR